MDFKRKSWDKLHVLTHFVSYSRTYINWNNLSNRTHDVIRTAEQFNRPASSRWPCRWFWPLPEAQIWLANQTRHLAVQMRNTGSHLRMFSLNLTHTSARNFPVQCATKPASWWTQSSSLWSPPLRMVSFNPESSNQSARRCSSAVSGRWTIACYNQEWWHRPCIRACSARAEPAYSESRVYICYIVYS